MPPRTFKANVFLTFSKTDVLAWKKRMFSDHPDFLESVWDEFRKKFNSQLFNGTYFSKMQLNMYLNKVVNSSA